MILSLPENDEFRPALKPKILKFKKIRGRI